MQQGVIYCCGKVVRGALSFFGGVLRSKLKLVLRKHRSDGKKHKKNSVSIESLSRLSLPFAHIFLLADVDAPQLLRAARHRQEQQPQQSHHVLHCSAHIFLTSGTIFIGVMYNVLQSAVLLILRRCIP